MGTNTLLGVIGGAMMVISTFMAREGLGTSGGPFSGSFSFLVFVSGVAVAVFLILAKSQWAKWGAIVAATLAMQSFLSFLLWDFGFGVRLQLFFIVAGAGLLFYAAWFGKHDPRTTKLPGMPT
jgi:hypothetical protein